MQITAITAQQKDKNRVNVMVDGKYRFSLDVFQYADLGLNQTFPILTPMHRRARPFYS